MLELVNFTKVEIEGEPHYRLEPYYEIADIDHLQNIIKDYTFPLQHKVADSANKILPRTNLSLTTANSTPQPTEKPFVKIESR